MSLYELVTGPTHEPVSLDMAKRQCSVELSETHFDSWFQGDPNLPGSGQGGAITAARERVESDSLLCFMPQTWMAYLDDWGGLTDGKLTFERHPVQAITEVAYYTAAGAIDTLDVADFTVRRGRYRSYLYGSPGYSYPSIQSNRSLPIQVKFTAGFAPASAELNVQKAAVPRRAVMAMLLLVGHWFHNREAVVVGTISKEIELGYKDLIGSLRPEHYR